MRGNDIVDLTTAAAENNWRRKGFLQKIFTPQEQEYIHTAASPDEMVWKIWSMKESAYKTYNRQYGKRSFAPVKIKCDPSANLVIIENFCYKTVTTVTPEYIYTLATPEAENSIPLIDHFFNLPKTAIAYQQQFIYRELVFQYAKASGKDKEDISFMKCDNGIPFLHCKRDDIQIPVSISHHGNYGAFCIF